MELVERLFEYRDFIISMFQLDMSDVLPAPHVNFDDIPCEVCGIREQSTDNPIILCDGSHGGTKVGYHINCLTPPLGYVPDTDWLCPACIANNFELITSVVGKRKKGNRVEYMVHWQGHDEPTWQLWQDIPAGSRSLVAEYNRTHR